MRATRCWPPPPGCARSCRRTRARARAYAKTFDEAEMLKTSAPGKLFLFGEYGVIRGGWSVVAAVDRRVIAQRREAATGYEIRGADFDDPLALPEAVVAQGNESPVSVAHLGADIRALYDVESGQKLGLGSSAASAVALSAALLLKDDAHAAVLTPRERQAIFDHAFRAHRALQNGRGSCADIAASTFGKTIAYRLLRPTSGLADLSADEHASTAEIQANYRNKEAEILSDLQLPPGLRVEAIWLGAPARSTRFVRACEEAFAREPAAMTRALAETSTVAEAAIAALQHSDSAALLASVERGDRALDELGALIGAPIITEAHRHLRGLAGAHQIQVKPSGAGGGDFSLAFGSEGADWDAFLQSLPALLRHIPLTFGAPGVARER